MGICHPKPSPPKTPFDDDDDDDAPPEHVTEVRGPSRQDVVDEHHHRRLLATATAAATLAAEGGYYDTDAENNPTLAARQLMACVGAIADARGRHVADARGRHVIRVRCDRLPSTLPEMNALFLAGDPVGKIVDAALDMMLY